MADYETSRRARQKREEGQDCAASASPAYRGLRHRALGSGGFAGRRRRPLGIGGSAREPVGTVEILTGSHSHGQGHETTFAQLVSDRLGIDINAVSIVHGDTDKVQMGMGTYGSRSGAVGMTAISKALDKIEAKAKRVAAAVMEASVDDIEFKNGTFTVKGTDKKMAFDEVALQAYVAHKFNSSEIEPGLKEGAFHDPSNFTFPAGTHICEVEVDSGHGRDQHRALYGGG